MMVPQGVTRVKSAEAAFSRREELLRAARVYPGPMEVRTEVEIDAPPEEVWAVLTDFEAYHEWNPFITRLRGRLEPGARLSVELSYADGRHTSFRPSLLEVKPAEELRWVARLWFKGLFDGEHFFRLQAIDSDRTRLVQGENFSGLFVKMAANTLTQNARGFVGMNAALKRRVESRRPPRTSDPRGGGPP